MHISGSAPLSVVVVRAVVVLLLLFRCLARRPVTIAAVPDRSGSKRWVVRSPMVMVRSLVVVVGCFSLLRYDRHLARS